MACGLNALVVVLILSCSSAWLFGFCEGHPLCLDSAPPYKAVGGLSFCSDYSDLGCCTTRDDQRISARYSLAVVNLTNATCAAHLKTLLCLECSPFAVHVYDAETTLARKPFPGLCRSYCGDIYRSCPNIVAYVTNSTVVLNALRSGESSFCSAVAITDMKYCYPDLLSDPEFNPNVTRNYSTTEGCLCMKRFAQNLRNPLLLLTPDDGSGRIFVGEQLGLVTIYYKNGTRRNDFFLDITNLVLESSSPGDERGFLGMAFHPNFRLNQKFYVYFSIGQDSNFRNRISEFTISTVNPNAINKTSERVLLEIAKPYSNHNGGQMLFGYDGYLYITTGDGGSGGDPQNNAQNLSSLLGKVLRIDVDRRGNGTAYAIPPTNPFVSTPSGARPEVYAYGCRNMWRCSIDPGDPVTGYGRGRLFCGDVGQAKWEEVDIIKSGGNYGWNTREGSECYNSLCGRIGPEELPIYAYDHSVGNCIIGGNVYRGCNNPNLQGLYFYADYGYGKLFRLRETSPARWENKEIFTCGKDVCFGDLTPDFERNILSFGEDDDGELYILTTSYPSTQSYSGSIYMIVDPRRRGDPSQCQRNAITSTVSTTSSTTTATTSTTTITTTTKTPTTTPTTTTVTTPTTTPTTTTPTTTTTTPKTTPTTITVTTPTTTPTTTTPTTTTTTPATTPSTTTTTTPRSTPVTTTTTTTATPTTTSATAPTTSQMKPTMTTTSTLPIRIRTTPAMASDATTDPQPTAATPSLRRTTPFSTLSSPILSSSSSSSFANSSTTTISNVPPSGPTTSSNAGNTTSGQFPNNGNWSCDFELANGSPDWCGISQASDDNFDWTIFDQPTPSDPTGPDEAFSGRFYIYIETSNPRMPNDTAKIYIPTPTVPGDYCLAFHYHMFGFHIRELQVFRETPGQSTAETIWRKSKQQGDFWLFAELTVNIGNGQKIGFIGVRGDEYSGDIGLDALSLTSGACK